jgi:hypothetical protein
LGENNENITVDVKKDFKISLSQLSSILDANNENYRNVESHKYVYRRKILDKSKDCTPIGNAFIVDEKGKKNEHSFELCGMKIKFLRNAFNQNNPKKFYEMDES